MRYTWGEKQATVLAMHRWPERYVILSGSVRSGKTHCAMYGFFAWLSRSYAGHDFLLATYTLRQMSAVAVSTLYKWAADTGAKLTKREAGIFELQSAIGRQPNRIITAIGHDRTAHQKILGLTLAGAYVDEAVNMPREFIDEIGLRCSVEGAKIVFTQNPKGPDHWMKRDYIDRGSEINARCITFQLTDNPSLSQAYMDQIRTQFTGVTFQRMVLGLWAAHSGLVYPYANKAFAKRPLATPTRYEGAIDVASSGITHALLIAKYEDGRYCVVDEWVHNGIEHGQITDLEQITQIVGRFTRGGRKVRQYVVDPAAAAFRVQLKDHVGSASRVREGFNDLIPGIENTRRWLDAGWIMIDDQACPELAGAMMSYQWDEAAADRGEDVPLKAQSHGPDALRYHVHTKAVTAMWNRVEVA